jgi:O-6-methylguanine DNA methyltransferase
MDMHEREGETARGEPSLLGETRQLLRRLEGLGEVTAPASIIPAVLGRVGLADVYFSLGSAIGPVFVAFNDQGISAVMPAMGPSGFEEAFRARFGRPARRIDRPPAPLARAMAAQLAGDHPHGLRFDLRGLSEFEQAVLRKALEIPRGEVRPYVWIAAEIERPGGSRAVGQALGHNPIPLLIPCHRVVRSDGRTGGYALGLEAKRAMLLSEGVELDRLEELAESRVRYYGSDTTHIFCYPTCRHARRVSDAHLVTFKSGAEALGAGYRPCKVCRPAVAAV